MKPCVKEAKERHDLLNQQQEPLEKEKKKLQADAIRFDNESKKIKELYNQRYFSHPANFSEYWS